MTLTVHQYKTAAVPPTSTPATIYTSISATWDTQPTAGRGLTLVVGSGKIAVGSADTPDGWTEQANITVDIRRLQVFTRQAEAGEPTTVTVTHPGARRLSLFMVEHDGEFGAITTDTDPSQTTHALPSITPTASAETLLLGFILEGNLKALTVEPSGYTAIGFIGVDDGASEGLVGWRRLIASASGAYTGTATYSGACFGCQVQLTVYAVPDPPVADFSASDTSIFEGQAVQFTDLSTNVPTSWAWTFGDGGTSTSQNPEHTYATAGTYTVTLTATNAFGSDIETKSGYITVAVNVGFDEPPPAQALIEIYTAEPGSAKWDEANWDEAEWSTAGWQNVTPESVQAVVVWGSSEPELGILSRPSAGSWSIDTYDPDRLMDPANEDSPYFGDLEPGLPIRISHRGVVIRQGIVESMSFGFADARGFIRVQDNIAPMANAMVPDDVDLGDTLYARAEAAIAAAGLAVTVLPVPPSGDPALVPWVTGTSRSCWQWIVDAAESVLHIPYIDNIGRLGFRAWDTPLSRARDLTATELIDLVSLVQYDGLFSVVTALDDDGVTVVERASTPPPRYGARTYNRNSATPDVADWLEAVLANRVRSGRRWIPGQVYPLNAASVEKYATIEAVERISLSHLFTSPPVAQDIIIVGGRITVTAKANDEALWAFEFQSAETVTSPLITEDGLGFVLSEGGDQFLYPE